MTRPLDHMTAANATSAERETLPLKKVKVLYVVSEMPIPATSGGKMALTNHLREVATDARLEVTVLAIDVGLQGLGTIEWQKEMGIQSIEFERSLPRLQSIPAILKAIKQVLFSSLPRDLELRANPKALSFVSNALKNRTFDVIVIDHYGGVPLIDGLEHDVPVLYIAHNVEHTITRQKVDMTGRFNPLRYLHYWEHRKAKQAELRLIKQSDRILCIATTDIPELRRLKGSDTEKVSALPEFLPRAPIRWKYSGTHSLLFVGSSGYFPNHEAILWLVQELAPRLTTLIPSLRIILCGTSQPDIAAERHPNVHYQGFVSEERLQQLHLECDAFICPIELGSGVKMKVLAALAHAMPVLTTQNGAAGLPWMPQDAIFDRSDAVAAAAMIAGMLQNPEALADLAQRQFTAYEDQLRRREGLLAHTIIEMAHKDQPAA
ncbi:glycosyltransferase [Tistrella mobilis]|nr:glycosyltransferase [Tistrella mobilis]